MNKHRAGWHGVPLTIGAAVLSVLGIALLVLVGFTVVSFFMWAVPPESAPCLEFADERCPGFSDWLAGFPRWWFPAIGVLVAPLAVGLVVAAVWDWVDLRKPDPDATVCPPAVEPKVGIPTPTVSTEILWDAASFTFVAVVYTAGIGVLGVVIATFGLWQLSVGYAVFAVTLGASILRVRRLKAWAILWAKRVLGKTPRYSG
jgi:uncharacterized YccA/Bax inhibitor family protein